MTRDDNDAPYILIWVEQLLSGSPFEVAFGSIEITALSEADARAMAEKIAKAINDHSSEIWVTSSTQSDTEVFSVVLGDIRVPALSEIDAHTMAEAVADAINDHSKETAGVMS